MLLAALTAGKIRPERAALAAALVGLNPVIVILATFDGPARAIRSAHAIAERVQELALEIRSGLHTGEVELAGDHLRGIAVHIGARTAALAGPGEVLVTSTVKDLVAGSGIEFEDRGARALKGVPGEWRVYRVTSA
jgi:class 3 adenylate cyclase